MIRLVYVLEPCLPACKNCASGRGWGLCLRFNVTRSTKALACYEVDARAEFEDVYAELEPIHPGKEICIGSVRA